MSSSSSSCALKLAKLVAFSKNQLDLDILVDLSAIYISLTIFGQLLPYSKGHLLKTSHSTWDT